MAVLDYVTAVVGVGIAGFGLLWVLSGAQYYFKSRQVTGEETTPIQALDPGPASVSGIVRPAGDGVITAPFTDRDCVAFEYTVRERDAGGGEGDTPDLIAEGSESVPFYVDDGTGTVLVRPGAADLEMEKEERISVTRNEDPPEPVERFLARREDIDEPPEPLLEVSGENVGKRYFRERLLETDEDVFVYGKASGDRSKEFGETRLEIREGAASGPPVLSPPTTFLIADRPREDLIGGYSSGGRAQFIIGLILIAIGSAVILATPLV